MTRLSNRGQNFNEGYNADGGVTISYFIDLGANFNTSYSGEVFPLTPDEQQIVADFAAAAGVSGVPRARRGRVGVAGGGDDDATAW